MPRRSGRESVPSDAEQVRLRRLLGELRFEGQVACARGSALGIVVFQLAEVLVKLLLYPPVR